MENRIVQTLTKLFERRRIVFWYDAKRELRNNFDSLLLPEVEKLELTNNEYGVKYRILRAQPENKFLLYREGPQPADLENWLLDVQLAHGVFSADQTSIWLSELGLDSDFIEVVQTHTEFYRAVKRKEALKRQLQPNDTQAKIRLKMLAVCAGSEPHMDAIVEILLQEFMNKKDEKIKLINRCGLDSFLWAQMAICYGYKSAEPGIHDFVIELFKSCYAMATGGQVRLFGDSLVFLKRWKNNRQFEACFEALSNDCEEVLGIELDLAKRDFRELMELDYFRLIDKKIISDLVRSVAKRTVSSENVAYWLRQRQYSHWFKEFQYIYEAIDHASQFILTLESTNLSMDTVADGILFYHKHWFRLDQLYRKFTYSVKMSGETSLMAELINQMENLYSNNYLLKLNNSWQSCLDQISQWDIPGCTMQKNFFKYIVEPLCKKSKVCVLISDALRYEVGEELARKIRSANGYEVSLECMVSSLPSYTQLGMAALLPHKTLTLADNSSGHVLLDDKPTAGLTARDKLLKNYCPDSIALKATDVLSYNKDQIRSLCRENNIIYVYHNHLDATGDSLKTEGRVFEAVEESVDELSRVIAKLGGENYFSQFIVTADHGFIYQNQPIVESDYISEEWESSMDKCVGEPAILHYQDRRFILGKNLPEHTSFKKFHSRQVGLVGDMEILIPKSINRLRLKGSGSRFVHGGASLQEVVIPVLKINKKRSSDVSIVEIDILPGSSMMITSGQLAAAFYQAQPVTDKVHPRKLRAAIYTKTGKIISDSHDLIFDLTSDNPRERELQRRFVLTRDADQANDQEVILKLEEKLSGTSHYKEYKSQQYQMRRSFTSDFDF